MPQACWPQSIPFTEAELNNNYHIAKRRRGGGERWASKEMPESFVRAKKNPVAVVRACWCCRERHFFFFFVCWILWFCLRKESKIERKNKVLLYKSAAAPCQIKGVTFLLLDYLSTLGAWQTANSWPATQHRRIELHLLQNRWQANQRYP